MPELPTTVGSRPSLTRFAWLSIGAALTTMFMKATAAAITGSVGLLSDALESVVNLVAALVALFALRAAAKAPDDQFAYGREKAEYLSAGVEGTMIMLAAVAIAVTAVLRLLNPQPLEKVGVGLVVSTAAALVNLAVALVLLRAGRTHRSITLEADGKHLMTDVWTSAGVLVGIGLVALTGWDALDPITALCVAVNIVVTGFILINRSVRGLLDASLPPDQVAAIEAVLDRYRSPEVEFHALRTRQAGRRSFMSLHVLVPGARSVMAAHDVVEQVEADLHGVVEDLTIVAHVEPLEDPRSFADDGLDRRRLPPSASGHSARESDRQEPL
jgi:cation diffusion facilitator family transporter